MQILNSIDAPRKQHFHSVRELHTIQGFRDGYGEAYYSSPGLCLRKLVIGQYIAFPHLSAITV